MIQKVYIGGIAFLVRIVDLIYPKSTSHWGFAVHHIKGDQFIENARAVFEEVKMDPSIVKILFTRDKTMDFGVEDAVNFKIVRLWSVAGLYHIVKCKVLFVTHSVSMDYSIRFGKSKFAVLKLNMSKRAVVNLWHGIPYKKLYALWNPLVKARLDRVKFRHFERAHYAGLISSSEIDSYAMAAMFYPIKYENVWVSGLPRNDFLRLPYNELPSYLKRQLDKVRSLKGTKKLVVYAPTYRQTTAVSNSEYYQFTDDEMNILRSILIENNAILGVRLHYFRNNDQLFNIEKYIDNQIIFDLGHIVSQEIAPVIREADLVISDYSSVFIEALYIDKPLVAFPYDFEQYRDEQDGVLYDYDMIFPGPIVYSTAKLFETINYELKNNSQSSSDRYKLSQRFFFRYRDVSNSKRVVEMTRKFIE
ncbi:MAG: CDP-glycerol glycerophosphotransferase family protein [Crocinitomicaceae bacterium]|nr:CDP-glycerol glycerophosphotransferase family protein [Crocinitomicaceae bacterium]